MAEATSSEDSSSSRHEPIPITRDPRALLIGIAVSIIFLAVGEGWAISLHDRSWILGLSAQWVALAVLPLLIGLVVGGYIPKISFAGVSFESPGYIKSLPGSDRNRRRNRPRNRSAHAAHGG
jgi:hypothetical protein